MSETPEKREVGARLAKEIARLGLENVRVAERCGVTVQGVGNWIRTGRIRTTHYGALMAMKIDVPWVLTGVGEPGAPRVSDLSREALEIARLLDECPSVNERANILNYARLVVRDAKSRAPEEETTETMM